MTQDDLIAILEIDFRDLIMYKLTEKNFKNRVNIQIYESAVKSQNRELENVLFTADEEKHRVIDYFEFGDLIGVFGHASNYTKSFEKIFGDSDIFFGYLKQIVQLRNPIEHHRGKIFREYLNEENNFLLKKAFKYFQFYIKKHKNHNSIPS